MQMHMVAMTIERYPNSGLLEKVEMTSENTPKVGQPMIIDDQRVITDSGMARAVAIEALNTITTPAGLLKVQVRLKNHTFSRENFLYHFEWFDINGMQVNNVVSAALPEQIEAGETKFITGIAPNPDCKDFRVKFIAGN